MQPKPGAAVQEKVGTAGEPSSFAKVKGTLPIKREIFISRGWIECDLKKDFQLVTFRAGKRFHGAFLTWPPWSLGPDRELLPLGAFLLVFPSFPL